MASHLVVHGHFYQPPRQNPWTEAVPFEASAAPAHDWNERIDAESYRPNGYARVVDGSGAVLDIVNNYALMSFNVGPTLERWLAAHAPDTLARMVAGDRAGGGAIAQPFHHVILPLANDRDRRTEIRWGLAAFERRFGRPAEGIWLPETAVDESVLAVLVEEGVAFTILAPGQAAARLDHGATYRWEHPGGAGSLTLVFYDGPLSHDVAFGAALTSAEALIDRAAAVRGSELVVLATDGETFGHHHKFTERAIAYALAVEAPRRSLGVGGLARWLRTHPATKPMAVIESAWSCAHGVGRWKADCGCSTGGLPGADQRWRAPLRAALDLLRDAAVEVFERRGAELLNDAWAARDAYVTCLLDPSKVDTFLAEHLVAGADRVEALTLLESQREALAMYTSCGWFFWDLAGIETIQVMLHAARCIDLLIELGEHPPLGGMLDMLATARSAAPGEGTGRDIWRRHVDVARVDGPAVLARVALLLGEPHRVGVIAPAFEIVETPERRRRGGCSLFAGRLVVVDRRTGRRHVAELRALADGDAVLTGWLRLDADRNGGTSDHTAALDAFARGASMTELDPTGDGVDGWRTIDAWRTLPGEVDEFDRVQQALDSGWWSGMLRAGGSDPSVLDACARQIDELLTQARAEQRNLPLERLQELLFDRLQRGAVTELLGRLARSAGVVPPRPAA